jgi:hypothetical protein
MVTSLAQLSERGAGRFPGVVVALTLAFLYGPVLVVGYLSLSPTAQPTIPLDALSVRWYGEIAQSTRFVRALVNSLVIGVAAAVGGTGLGLAGAYTITRSRLSATVRRGLALVIALPLFVPTVVVAFGIGRASAIAGLGFGYLPVILGHLFWVLPFTTFLLAARYAELDAEVGRGGRPRREPPDGVPDGDAAAVAPGADGERPVRVRALLQRVPHHVLPRRVGRDDRPAGDIRKGTHRRDGVSQRRERRRPADQCRRRRRGVGAPEAGLAGTVRV